MQKLLAANSTASSFTARGVQETTPATTSALAVIQAQGKGILDLIFFGAGSDNTTFDYRILGWTVTGVVAGVTQWAARIIAQGSVTLSGLTGTATYPIVNTDRLADTIDLDYGVAVLYNGPTDAAPAMLEIPLTEDFPLIEVQFDMTGATNGNALYSLL